MLSGFIYLFVEFIFLFISIDLIKGGFGGKPLYFLPIVLCLATILFLHEMAVTCIVEDEDEGL